MAVAKVGEVLKTSHQAGDMADTRFARGTKPRLVAVDEEEEEGEGEEQEEKENDGVVGIRKDTDDVVAAVRGESEIKLLFTTTINTPGRGGEGGGDKRGSGR